MGLWIEGLSRVVLSALLRRVWRSQTVAGAGGPSGLEHPRWFYYHVSSVSVLLPWPLSPHMVSSARSFLSSEVIRLPAG